MGRLVLVRHAQASFLAEDYDRLSPLGERQARLLGDYWTRRSMRFDRAFSGPRVRQRDTAQIVAEAYRSSPIPFPEPVAMREFDEYEGEAVLKKSLPQLLKTDRVIRHLQEAFAASTSAAEQRSNFQKLFENVIGRWVDRKIAVPEVESWSEFCARVNRGLSHILSEGRSSEQVAVFSSGGPIAIAMQRALHLSPQDALRTSWTSRNCSYSEFLFSADRFTLSAFNASPHLDDPELLTYR